MLFIICSENVVGISFLGREVNHLASYVGLCASLGWLQGFVGAYCLVEQMFHIIVHSITQSATIV